MDIQVDISASTEPGLKGKIILKIQLEMVSIQMGSLHHSRKSS